VKRKTNLSKQRKTFDKGLLYSVLVLLFLGLVAVADASAPQALAQFNDKFYFFKQQILWAGIGVVSMFVVSLINYKFWEKVATPFFFVTFVLLIAVLIPGLSYEALGARRWISVPFVNFQPAELIKLSLALYFAKLAKSEKGSISYFLPLAGVLGLIMLQPDLGSALSISVVGLSQIFISGISLIHFTLAGILGIGATAILILTSPYRRDRLTTFLQGVEDPLGKGYHVRQILLALGSGGIFGVGIGASRQKYLFLPEASTDSIFAIIAEELGLFGAVAIIGIFAFFLFRGFKIARSAPDKFSQVLAVGLTAWIGGQAFLNIASMVALVPLTGIPLPFFSYGGSSLVMILVACGILLNISTHSTHEKK
jgi:cell division protein FtsW